MMRSRINLSAHKKVPDMSVTAAQRAWIERVLGIALQAAPEAGREPPGPTGPNQGLVAYRTLLLRWRSAQSRVDASLRTVGATLLARPDIKADPRLKDIQKAVSLLPKLVPAFGGKLEDVLDAGLNATDPAEQARLAKEGIAAIDAYREKLSAATGLLKLERFAAEDLGAKVELHRALDETLTAMKAQLV
jgi:hypothetical protein